MNSSASSSKLPTWLFVTTDLALIAAAWFIASQSARPLSNPAILAIVTCVGLGAIVGLLPLVARYERQKNETLDDRQRALEALARTVSASAEQISIAAAGLHGIAEIAQKNLRQAEQLPHKLQDKIAEFQAQLSAVEDAEKEELERELLALRTTESERLETVSQRIAKSAADWSKVEQATQQHLAAAHEALGKLSMGTASAIGKAQVAAEQALGQARIEAARALGEASGQATRALESAKIAALADFEAKLTAAAEDVVEKVTRNLGATLATFAGSLEEKLTPTDSAADAPPPIPIARIGEVTAVTPHTADPFPAPSSNGSAVTAPPAAAATDGPTTEERARTMPRRTAKKTAAATAPAPGPKEEPGLGLDLDDSAPNGMPAGGERVITSDGATRLIVTAYIGIGNRLFIRGAGPGLTWEKGVPLQFVSIGKWRWETNDANAPVQFKIYKNDEIECAALGSQTLDPGHQQEVTAAF